MLSSAFDACKDFLRTELSQRDYDYIIGGCANDASLHDQAANRPPKSDHNIDAFVEMLHQARRKYEDRVSSDRTRAKARAWLTSLSARDVCYGNILDVLVQHHPEYVSLIWGSFKFLFVVSNTRTRNRKIPLVTYIDRRYRITPNSLARSRSTRPALQISFHSRRWF